MCNIQYALYIIYCINVRLIIDLTLHIKGNMLSVWAPQNCCELRQGVSMWLHHLLSLAHKLLLMPCTLHCTIIYCLWWPTLMIRSSVIQHTHIGTYTGLCYCYCTTDRYINVWYTLYSIHTCMVHTIQYSHMHGTCTLPTSNRNDTTLAM